MKEITQFLHEVRVEFSKVVWPKTNEFIGSTIIVLFLVVVFAIYLGIVDTLFTKIINAIIEFFKVKSVF